MKLQLAAGALALALTGCSGPAKVAAPEASKAAQTSLLEMGEPAQRRAGVEIGPAAEHDLREQIQATGTVQPIDSRVSHVRSLARGRLLDVSAKVGDRVKAGHELARVDNLEAGELASQLISARAELERLHVLLAAQRKREQRSQRLVELEAAPRREYEDEQAERRALEAGVQAQQGVVAGLQARLRRFSDSDSGPQVITSLRAPFDGIVTRVLAAPGEVVDASTELFTVADLSRVWVQAEVYEQDLGRLALGQTALIHVDTYAGEQFTGHVAYISDTIDPQTRTARVRCETPNPATRLKLDMFATVRLPTTFNRRALAVPEAALQQLEGRPVVFVRRAPTRFEARPVETGKTVGGFIEIRSGLRAGEPIVIAGSFHLKSIALGSELGEE